MDRAVTEPIGFAFTLAMILLAIALIQMAGMGAVTEIHDRERATNGERAMSVLAEVFADVERGAPARSSEIRLLGGSLVATNGSELGVTVDGSGITPRSYTLHPGTLAFTLDDVSMLYEAGALVRVDRSGTSALDAPSLYCDGDLAVVSLVSLRSPEPAAVTADGSVTVKARHRASTLRYPDAGTRADAAGTVSVNVGSSAVPAGWIRYFETRPGWARSGSSFTCSAERVYVRETVVTISIEA